jgi:hypothetical protein
LLTANTLTLKGTSIGARGAAADLSSFVNTQVSSLDLTATSGGIFVNQKGSVLVSKAAAPGNIDLIAQGANADMTVQSVAAGAHTLLIAGDNILAANTGSPLVSGQAVELRAGLENSNGSVGSAATQLPIRSSAGPLPSLTLVLPGTPGTGSKFLVPVHVFVTPSGVLATEPAFQGKVAQLYTVPFGGAATYLNINTPVVNITTDQLSPNSAENNSAGRQVLYIDWSSFDPNVSLFGTVNPAICLPSDQREEDNGQSGCVAGQPRGDATPNPVRTAFVFTRGGWKTLRAFELSFSR